jgi:hypothetical protein
VNLSQLSEIFLNSRVIIIGAILASRAFHHLTSPRRLEGRAAAQPRGPGSSTTGAASGPAEVQAHPPRPWVPPNCNGDRHDFPRGGWTFGFVHSHRREPSHRYFARLVIKAQSKRSSPVKVTQHLHPELYWANQPTKHPFANPRAWIGWQSSALTSSVTELAASRISDSSRASAQVDRCLALSLHIGL